MNEQTRQLKGWLSTVPLLRRACAALKEEFAQLASGDEVVGEELIWEMVLERRALGRELAQRGLRHRLLLEGCVLKPLERQVLQQRYVQGKPWTQIVAALGRSKGYLIRVHNRGLQKLSRAVYGDRVQEGESR